MLNQLKLTKIPFNYEIDNETHSTEIGEFLIDEKPLAEWFGIERNLENCDTDIGSIPTIEQQFFQGLTGKISLFNQFGTNTFTLYRCHCGCDYCGVVSCEIIITENYVIWQNVGYENDVKIDENKLDDSEKWQLTRLSFTFDKAEYPAEIQRFKQILNA